MVPKGSRPKIPASESPGSEKDLPGQDAPPPPLTRREFVRYGWRRIGLAAGAFVAGLVIDAVWARVVRGPGLERTDFPRLVVGSWRVHHSVAGYLAVAVGAFVFPGVLVPLGLGIIVGHGRRDRWGFLERVDRT